MKLITFISILFFLSFPSATLANQYHRVTLISSSTQYDENKITEIRQALIKKGYSVNEKYLNQVVSDFGYVNKDESRANVLISALLDRNTDILWFIRGGGGAFNLLPYLEANKEKLKKTDPKIIIGFSDVTAIHYFVNNILGWPSVHGVLASNNKEMNTTIGNNITINDKESLPSIKKIFNNGIQYQNLIPLNESARKGVGGKLAGGNFTLIQSFFSTKYEASYLNKILILEDTGVSFRGLDRSLHQLLYKTDLNVNAIVFGQFYPLDPTDEQRLIYKTVIKNFANKVNIPIYYFPFFGHGRENKPLILGREASISCFTHKQYCTLIQN